MLQCQLLKPKLSPKECRNCGGTKYKSKDECPAAENKCPCGIKGHDRRYSFTWGKPKKQKKDKKDKEEGSDNNCNTFNTCFYISVNDVAFLNACHNLINFLVLIKLA